MTPLMQQFWSIKNQHTDKILLFRMGDFFEMFHQDAETAAPILNIALTQRNKKSNDDTKMCGVPHHSIAGPIAKLLAAGFKVAICDQVEDPATAKGLVKRAVTRILTPGMVYDPDTLDQLSHNFLCSYDAGYVAFADVTTGEAFYFEVENESARKELLQLLSPVELVLTPHEAAKAKGSRFEGPIVSAFEFTAQADSQEPLAAQRLRQYAREMQGEELAKSLIYFERRHLNNVMELSSQVIQHLEIFETYKQERKGSLFWAVNRTQTSSGARLLKNWLAFPLTDLSEIHRRQQAIETWIQRPSELKRVRELFTQMGDIERRLGKILSSTGNARDLVSLANSLQVGLTVSQLANYQANQSSISQLAQNILKTLVEDPPHFTKEGGLIRAGVSPELDELMTLTQDSQQLLLELENNEREQTGISSLKVRYNNVFGYYIELTKTHAHKAPKHYMRKQTLANAERFTTDALNKLEEKVLSARAKRDQLEFEIYSNLRAQVIQALSDLTEAARGWAREDAIVGLAWLAMERKYTKPKLNSQHILLELNRHPVVEQTLGKGFVPNTIRLEPGGCLLLTGPNMAGKSTLMRQVALAAILAQTGSFVPATRAEMPLFHQVFTRVGASDSLSEGLSTFMVEMSETSHILKKVDQNSLVVMDEIGRGTSTYDGLSLAQAILEYLVSMKRPFLLFATHYHELVGLAQMYPSIHNAHIEVHEKNGDIQFLHTLKVGPANRSYGIQVAKLAGLPKQVTDRARELLGNFEAVKQSQMSFADMISAEAPTVQAPESSPIHGELAGLNLSQLTPLEALTKLHEWQQKLS